VKKIYNPNALYIFQLDFPANANELVCGLLLQYYMRWQTVSTF